MESPIVMSLGGSLIVPHDIDSSFLRQFHDVIVSEIHKGKEFIIICGGGAVTRKYQHAAKEVGILTHEDLDWLGINVTRLNGQLLRTIFRHYAYPRVVKDPRKRIATNKPIIIAAGWKPGFSTDYDAVVLARTFHAKRIINLSNITHVHDKDPKAHTSAVPITDISWQEFRKMVGNTWDPGMNVPFDPIASRLAQRLGLTVVIAKGNDFTNLKKVIDQDTYTGTTIRP